MTAQRSADRPRAVVLGAGISGLAAAWALSPTHEVVVVEAAGRPGGTLSTVDRQGCLIELGPNTVQGTEAVFDLCARAGCRDRLKPAAGTAKTRFIVRRGRLQKLPSSPPALLTSPVLSIRGKLRLLGEPLVGRRRPQRRPGASKSGGDPLEPEERSESVSGFLSRRLGSEVARTLGDAMVLGIYAGDPEQLGVDQAFPRLVEWEARHGSLFRALVRSRKAGQGRPPLVSFDGGFQALAATIAAPLDVRYGLVAEAIEPRGGRFSISVSDRQSSVPTESAPTESAPAEAETSRQKIEPLIADRLIVALPAAATANVLRGLADTSDLRSIPHAPVAVVSLSYPRSAIQHPLDGFGFLVPHREGRDILGCLFSSTLFPARAPEDRALLTVMIGGSRRPELVALADDDLVEIAGRELGQFLGIEVETEPIMPTVKRWQPGIPQPGPATLAAKATVDRLEAGYPGLTILGNWLHGVGVPDCITAGLKVGAR